jgi:D-alanine-D-alanine ligase
MNGSSIGLSIVGNESDLPAALELAFKFDERAILEEYIKGRELTVGILGDQALPIIEIAPKAKFFDYEAKYKSGLTEYIIPAVLEKEQADKISQAALSAHKLLGCRGCSRVDIILSEGLKPVILEINTIPGFTNMSLLPKAAKCAGIEFDELCLKLIGLAYEPGIPSGSGRRTG